MKIGSHVSIAGGLEGAVKEALSYGANTFMIYTGAPQQTKRKKLEDMKIEEGKKIMAENGIDEIVVHAPYIINLATNKPDSYDFAVEFLSLELERTKALGSNYLVIHPGAYTTATLEEGTERIVKALNLVLKEDSPIICLETMAGKGSEIGRNFNELKTIIDGVNLKDKIGVCFDTCHTHDSGLDIVNNLDGVMSEFDKLIGLDKIKVFHINGSLNERGAKKDRHANIGADDTNPKGVDHIGFEAIHRLVHSNYCKGKLLILETPWLDKNTNLYKKEIECLRNEKI